MKSVYFSFLLIFFISIQPSLAQDTEIKTVFDGKVEYLSGFGGTFMSFSRLNGQFAQLMGGYGGLLLNHKLIIGGYGKSLTTDILSHSEMQGFENTKIKLTDGGIVLGYVHNYFKSIHITSYIMAGYGTSKLKDELILAEKGVICLNPVVEFEMNITKHLRMGFGADCNLYYGIERLADLLPENFRKPGVFVSFKGGWF